MQLFCHAFPPNFRLYLGGDFHVGSLLTHYQGIAKFVESVYNDADGYFIGMGDCCEAICVDDKRFDPNTAEEGLSVSDLQYLKFEGLIRPIADKTLYLLDGNHDYKHYRTANFVKNMVCRNLSIPYGTYTAKLSIYDTDGKLRDKVFTGHGWKSLSSSADDPIREHSNLILSLKRRMKYKTGDCRVMAIGHTHRLLSSNPMHRLYLTDADGELKQKYFTSDPGTDFIHPDHRFYVNTGSFLKNQVLGSSGYAERFGYDPVELGYAVVHYEGYRPVHVEEVRV